MSGPHRLVDPECYDLAEYFLADEPVVIVEDVRDLASVIQEAVELWLGGRTKGDKDVSSPPVV